MAQRTENNHATNGHDLHDHSVGELVRQLAEEAGTLVRQEVKLATVEMTEKAQESGKTVGIFGAASLLGLAGFAALTTCFIAALASAMPVWLAALVVTVLYLAAAGILALVGRERVKKGPSPVPEQTVQSIKEDVQWVKTQGQYGRR